MKRSIKVIGGSLCVILGLLAGGVPSKAGKGFDAPKETNILTSKKSGLQYRTQVLAEFRKEMGILRQSNTRSAV